MNKSFFCVCRAQVSWLLSCKYQCFQSSAFLRKSAIFVLSGNFCTWFSNLRKKILKKIFFFFKNFFSVKKKKQLFRVTIFRKQNGGWTHLRKKNKKFFRRKWRPSSSAQGEQEKWHSNSSCARRIRKAETSLKPPSLIFLPIRSVCIGMIGSLNMWQWEWDRSQKSDYTSTI